MYTTSVILSLGWTCPPHALGLTPDGRKIIYLSEEMSTPAIFRCNLWGRDLQHKSGLSLWGTIVNLPPKLCPQGSFHRIIWCGKDEGYHMGRIKKCSGGTEKVHAFVPDCIWVRVALREEEGCRRLALAASFPLSLSKSGLFAFLCGVCLPATWQTFYMKKKTIL